MLLCVIIVRKNEKISFKIDEDDDDEEGFEVIVVRDWLRLIFLKDWYKIRLICD